MKGPKIDIKAFLFSSGSSSSTFQFNTIATVSPSTHVSRTMSLVNPFNPPPTHQNSRRTRCFL
ncbi:hypothetical protein Hanom_Chr05g00438841 [Helianthus anomalus]